MTDPTTTEHESTGAAAAGDDSDVDIDSARTRRGFFDAAELAVALLLRPEVAGAWDRPSALDKFSVNGLAGHLARQITRTVNVVASSATADPGEPLPLLGHYSQVRWIGADLDSEVNAGIRNDGEGEAADGAATLAAKTTEAVDALQQAIAKCPPDAVVRVPQGWSLRLDDFLITRMMEIAVHADDLAVSVGIETPDLPLSVAQPVLDLLRRLSTRRHGDLAVLRAFSRAERAPASVTAF